MIGERQCVEPIDYWKLCTEYSVVQAALLTCGHDPDAYQYRVEDQAKQPTGYNAVRSALRNAILSGSLEANARYSQGDFDSPPTLNLHDTTIHFADLARFLKTSGFSSPVFERPSVSTEDEAADFAYPPKLAAANKAWAAVTANPALLVGKSPKQALEKWLIENSADLQLLNRDGTVNRTGIEEICKVANWKPSGGATPTPSVAKLSTPLIQLPAPGAADVGSRETYDLNDDIPF